MATNYNRIAMNADIAQHIQNRAKKLNVEAWQSTRKNTHDEYSLKHSHTKTNNGIEFSKVREYTAGDDPRYIDWNVSAKYNKLYVKEFTEENDASIYVVIDSSSSTIFGSGQESKSDKIRDIGMSLVLSATLHKNSKGVGFGAFSDSLEMFILAKKGKQHTMNIIRNILQYKSQLHSSRRTNLVASISQLASKIKHKSIIFLISDYIIMEPFAEKIRLLSRSHIVVMIHVTDKHEIIMPDIGYAYLEDIETGQQILVDTSKKEFQNAYIKMAKGMASDIKRQALAGNATYMNITDEEPYNITFNRHASKISRRHADKVKV